MNLNNNPMEDDSVKVEVLRLKNENLNHAQISRLVGVDPKTISRFLNKVTYKDWWAKNSKPLASGTLHDHRENVKTLPGTAFILTSAQNNTFVHDKFLKSLKVAADHLDAQIIVGTYSYNKSGFQNLEKGEGDWFDPKIKDYILDEPAYLAEGLLWCGEMNILPTAANPLSGMHSYAKNNSAVFPHAKVQLESMLRGKFEKHRMLYTTGSVTKRNYIEKKAGQKASFHHIFGALLVEVDEDGDWFARQLISDSETGEFYDLNTLYTPTGVKENVRVEGINWGDVHIEKIDPQVKRGCFDIRNDSMLSVLKPLYQFVHDVLDFEARNHHNIKDPYFRFMMHKTEQDNVQGNIKKVAEFLALIERDFSIPVIVESNHDLAFIKWLKESDYKTDPENAIYFLENQLAQYKAMERGDKDFSIFEHAVKREYPDTKSLFLRVDESFKICNKDGNGIECGNHGHLGGNGARGSIASFIKLGTRQNVGHSHSAAIKDGVYYAGVCGSLDMGYNQGASSWSHSMIVTYPNGKRAIITMTGSKWRA